MAEYRISGVWMNSNKVITHYAFHKVESNTAYRATKKTKAEAIELLETPGNTATTYMWNYSKQGWGIGEKVDVVKGNTGKYLRTTHDNKLIDNLAHLIDFDWIAP